MRSPAGSPFSIPNGDGYSDRMYAADLGGRIFRYDITNGNSASTLVAGGVFAALGQGLAVGGSNPYAEHSQHPAFLQFA